MHATSPAFKANVTGALADAGLQKALTFTRPRFPERRAAAGACAEAAAAAEAAAGGAAAAAV